MKKLLIPSVLLPLFFLLSCGQKTKHVETTVRSADYQKAHAFLDHNRDSAFYYFNKVTISSHDSLEVAKAYTNMAMIQTDAGDNYGAQESLSRSLNLLKENNAENRSLLANDYNELGITSTNLKNYDQAIEFYQRSQAFTDNRNLWPIIMNNEANVYRMKKDYSRALQLYRKVLPLTGGKGSTYTSLLTNMATTCFRKDAHYNPVPEFLKALRIRLAEKDQAGVNSSYAHLTDFYMHPRPDSALFYAEKWFALARQIHGPEDELSSLAVLIKLSPAHDTRSYFTRYQHLDDSLQTARNAAKNQFALIRYNVEKSKTDNLRLQKENAEKRYQITVRTILLGAALFLLASGGILGRIWYRRRKQRMELEKKNEIQNHELRVSQRVHDLVANGLYQVMSGLENQEQVDRDNLLDQIEDLYEQSRDISYEKNTVTAHTFPARIASLLASFAGREVKVAVVGAGEINWDTVSLETRDTILLILREFMVNMKKHSRATSVAVRFVQQPEEVDIYYTDNGIGFPDTIRMGNGLSNTGNRIKSLGGTLTFSTAERGAKIHMALPAV